MKGGVLIIGSLLWDTEKGRPKWRKDRLDEKDKIQVYAPIRYGRNSSGVKTMVLSKDIETNNLLGKAFVLPFKRNVAVRGLFNQMRFLSLAEGNKDDKLVKGNNDKWCILGILFNPAFDRIKKQNILLSLHKKLKKEGLNDWYRKISISPEQSILSEKGEILINWLQSVDPLSQHPLDMFDFVLATCTVPNIEAYPSVEEMRQNIINDTERLYFHNNHRNNIVTFQDEEILHALNLYNL